MMIKKISNWLVGSFFRTIGRFLAIAGIGILFYIIASKSGLKLTDLLGISRVYADENFTYSNALWSYTYTNTATNCSSSLRNCTINNYPANSSLNTEKSVDYINTIRLYAYASDTNKFKSSNYYNFKYEVCQSEKDFNQIKTGRGFSWQYNTSNQATGSTAGDPTQFNYKIDDKVGDNNCYYLTFSAKPPVDSRYIGFFFTYTGYGDNVNAVVVPDIDYFNYTGGTYNVKSLSVSFSQDVNATINNSTNQIINNNNQNTQDIINNNNQNTQDIINNQNQNTQEQINSQKICNSYDKNSISKDNYYLNYENIYVSYDTYGVTDFININGATIKILEGYSSNTNASYCFYNVNKTLISCSRITGLTSNSLLTIPDYSYYFKFSINKSSNKPQFEVCKNGNQGVSDSINDLNDTLTDDTINNSDIENGLDLDYDTSQSYGAFSGFLLLPLTWVQQILAPQDSCSAINLPLPYMENKYLTLPCMNEFWNSIGLVGDLISLVWIAVVGVRIFNGLYLLVVDVTSTEDNAEKLDKVRSWEL